MGTEVEGSCVGANVGLEDAGDLVNVGDNVGLVEGATEGAVGAEVVGKFDGDSVGAEDDGFVVGDVVGVAVGAHEPHRT